MKKFFSVFLLSVMIISIGSLSVKADSGQGVSLSFFSYDGKGSVDGSKNGAFYTLTPGHAYIEVTGTNATSDDYFSLELRRKPTSIGFEKSYGSVLIAGLDDREWKNLDATSSNYFLKAYGGAHKKTNYELTGLLHDHHK